MIFKGLLIVNFHIQELIPQLFARLSSHPKQVVRKQLEGLLLMLAKLCPWSVVYPTLVDLNAYEGQPLEELQRILDCLVIEPPVQLSVGSKFLNNTIFLSFP